ncbi:MAG TPA: hypothetical protein DCG49_05010, partial [Ruminococcus sp.]|nr:hypothetical protein [Ruminococcus sp.]
MKKEKTNKNGLYYLLSFLFPFAIILGVFAINGLDLFGDQTVLIGDAGAQYYPFLMMLRQTVREGGSLLYTWKAGLGISLLPMISYYISSPLNLISILLPEGWIRVWLMLAVCIRYGIAGLSFTVMVRTIKPKLTVFAPLFGTVFALCSWTLLSYWQIIWMDTVSLTPLVLAGLIRAVRDRDYRLYPIALAVSLFCNFYIGFITCMMTGFCWIGLMIVLRKPLREIPKEAGRFIGLSVISAAMCALFFIPVLLEISNAARANSGTLSFTRFYESLPRLLGQFASLIFPIVNNHPPSLASSMLVLMLPLPFLTVKKIDLRERIFCFAMTCFLLFSLWYEPLNIMWHGFHFPGGTVDRFAYLVPLMLAYMGWRYTECLAEEKVSVRELIVSLLLTLPLPVLVLICAAKVGSTDIPLVSALYVALYLGLYGLRIAKPQKRGWFTAGLVLMVIGEVALNSYSHVMRQSYTNPYLVKNEYIDAAAQKIKSEWDPMRVSRTGVASLNSFGNFELLLGVPCGSSSFNSLNKRDLQEMCIMLGFEHAHDSCYYKYHAASPLIAQLLN